MMEIGYEKYYDFFHDESRDVRESLTARGAVWNFPIRNPSNPTSHNLPRTAGENTATDRKNCQKTIILPSFTVGSGDLPAELETMLKEESVDSDVLPNSSELPGEVGEDFFSPASGVRCSPPPSPPSSASCCALPPAYSNTI